MLLQVLLSQVLQVPLRKADVSLHTHTLVVTVYLHTLAQVSSPAADLDAGSEEFCEVGSIEDLVLDGLGAVDGEGVRDLGISGLFLDSLGLRSSGEGGLGLFCGHWIIDYNIKMSFSHLIHHGIAKCSNYSSVIYFDA